MPDHQWNLNIATYSVRSVVQEYRLREPEEDLEWIKWDIIGIGEVRRSSIAPQLNSGRHL